MSRPAPSFDGLPFSQLRGAVSGLEQKALTSQTPRQWFDAALRYADAARAAERRGSKQGMYVEYTRLALAFSKCMQHPGLKDAKATDPQWAARVHDFMATMNIALGKAKNLKEELKAEELSSTKTTHAQTHKSTSSVDLESGGSIADRMKALRGHGVDVSTNKRVSRDYAPPRSGAAAAGSAQRPAVPPAPAGRPTQDLHARSPSIPQPPSIPTIAQHGSSASLSGVNGSVSPVPTDGSSSDHAPKSPVKASIPVPGPTPDMPSTSHTQALAVAQSPDILPSPPPTLPVAAPGSASTTSGSSEQDRRTEFQHPAVSQPSVHRTPHPLPTPPAASVDTVSPTDAAERLDQFEHNFPSLDELGKQFEEEQFKMPALPTAPASNGHARQLPEPPKKADSDGDEAAAFLSFPSLPSVPTDLPGSSSRAVPKPPLPLPPPPPPPRLDLEDASSSRADTVYTEAPPSPPSPDVRRQDRPASTLGFSAQNSLSLSPFTTSHTSILDDNAKLKSPPVSSTEPPSGTFPGPSPSTSDLPTSDPTKDTLSTGPGLLSASDPNADGPTPDALSPPAHEPLTMPEPRTTPPVAPKASGVPPAHTKPNFPFTSAITPETLRDYFMNPAVDVLLLDVRTSEDFGKGYVGAEYHARGCRVNIVWIDPTILMRDNLTSAGLEDALSVSPEAQLVAFQNRNKYDIVVIVDLKSKMFPAKGATQTPAGRLRDIIFEYEFAKVLPRSPALLVGGYEGWVAFIEGRRAMHMQALGMQQYPQDNSMLPYAANGHASTPLSPRTTNTPAIPDRRNKPFHPPSPSAHYSKEITENFSHNGAPQSMTSSRHHQYSASYSSGAASYMPYQQTPAPTRPPILPRASHGSSTSISNNYGAPQRQAAPSHHRQDSFSNYATPSGIALPPRASVHTSAMTRRQSSGGYMDYGSSPGSQPRIDYPQAHALVRVPQPPPAAASHALERQDARQPMRLPPRDLAQFGETGVRYWRDQRLGLTGLKNLGNTCYMNSTVQCLSATYPFARFFLDGTYKRDLNTTSNLGTKGRMAKAFADLLGALWGEDWNCLSPITFRQSIIGFNDLFAGNQQHDSQEFLSFVLDGLHEDLNRVKVKPHIEMTPEREKALETLSPQVASDKEWQLYRERDDSFIVDLFQGQYMSRTTCLTCYKTSTVYDSFMWLTLDLPATKARVMLPELIDRWVQPETLSVEDGWVCTHCKVKRKATKALTLVRLPPVLLIQLKRFSFSGGFWNRSDTPVIFPTENLDLTRLVPRRENTGAENLDDPRTQIGPFKYDLYGVTNHAGTLSSGHYTAFIRSSGKWMYAEDSRISAASERDVISHPAASYILFYKRVQRS